MADNSEYNQRVNAYYTPNQPFITAEEVLTEIELRCSSGQQYTTFPNQITDEEKALIEAKNYIVTRNYIDSENRDGAEPEKLYIGFQVALTEDAIENAMVISQAETNGVGEGGGGSATLIKKTITSNGTYTASSDSADGYSKVTVNVPNTYTAQDEGKVVDNGALVAQTAMSSEVTENGTVDTTLYNSITVNVPSGGSSATRKDVNLYDYDGTIVNSYTAAEFAELSAMPDNPTHEGLTAQGWNWSLSDAKTYVASYGKLEIGQMYITSDGKTRIYITLPEGMLTPTFGITINSNSEIDIDWGDGSTHSSYVSQAQSRLILEQHEYATAGDYIISLTMVSGSFKFSASYPNNLPYLLTDGNDNRKSPDRAYTNAIKKIEIGTSITALDMYCFSWLSGLETITIPESITNINTYTFNSCYSLKAITIPNRVPHLYDFLFSDCFSLESIALPKSLVRIDGNLFYNCYSLKTVTVPEGTTTLKSRTFYNCNSLEVLILPNTVTTAEGDAIYVCHALNSLTIPNSVTSLNTPNYCSSLLSVKMSNSIVSLGQYAFSGCDSLTSITLSDTITSIGANAFQYCYSLRTITIDKVEGSISGSPWGAITGSPTSTQIIWTG